MLLIPCPYCGDRAQTEFTYRGDATVERPPAQASAQEWYDFVYTRDNPRGEHTEWWHHSAGCRRWIKVRRNTWTHEVLGSESANSDRSQE
ncbi:MAG: sarcosine oxidase subunit delta [Acidiferrobacterales bacterium]|nr:sarcosine oxidase subunit delta [Acidiferrobacterales bacterium]